MSTVLITGAGGFIARHLAQTLAGAGMTVLGASHSAAALPGCSEVAASTPVLQFASVLLSMLTLRLTRLPEAPRKSRCDFITPESSTAMPTPRPSMPL